MLPPSGRPEISTTCSSVHSMLTGDSATRGARTRSLGTGVRPDIANSSTFAGNSAEQTFICSTISSLTMLTTNSLVSRTLASVSFIGSRHTGQNSTTGGSPHTALKKLNGARLLTPAADVVETNAIGRGTTEPTSRR